MRNARVAFLKLAHLNSLNDNWKNRDGSFRGSFPPPVSSSYGLTVRLLTYAFPFLALGFGRTMANRAYAVRDVWHSARLARDAAKMPANTSLEEAEDDPSLEACGRQPRCQPHRRVRPASTTLHTSRRHSTWSTTARSSFSIGTGRLRRPRAPCRALVEQRYRPCHGSLDALTKCFGAPAEEFPRRHEVLGTTCAGHSPAVSCPRNSSMCCAISSALSSSAKWPVSSKCSSARGRSVK